VASRIRFAQAPVLTLHYLRKGRSGLFLSPAVARSNQPGGGPQMIVFLISFAFVTMVLFPAILATIHRSRSLNSDD
jgi:hypothetical protein